MSLEIAVPVWLLILAYAPLAPEATKCADLYRTANSAESSQADRAEACHLASEPVVPYRFPTTGAIFSLPEIESADKGEGVILPALPQRPMAPDLFHMKAIPVRSGPQVAKLERAMDVDFASDQGPWTELLSEARKLGPAGLQTTEMVNIWVNWHVRYREDANSDVWSDARTTLEQRLGDCEDIAISKMALLTALGTPPESMFLVIARDDRNVDHAVLAVRNDSTIYILDNRTDVVANDSTTISSYVPILSLSRKFTWTYGLLR